MKCNVLGCDSVAVTYHGIVAKTHGYCEAHRCCARCGLQINNKCECKRPKERKEYVRYLKDLNKEKKQ